LKVEGTTKLTLLRIREGQRGEVEDLVAREFPFTIVLNNQELVTLLCSPTKLRYLAVGFLFSEGLVKDKAELKKVLLDERRGIARVETVQALELAPDFLFRRFITSGCGRGASFYHAIDAQNVARIETEVNISPEAVLELTKEFQRLSEIYLATHGVHGAALSDTRKILAFSEDIGRHNAVDKIFGQCLLEEIPTEDKILLSSGRISSEMLLKAAKGRIPIIISISAPTDLAVKLASELGVTLIAFVRGKKFNIYANEWRVVNGLPGSEDHRPDPTA